MQLMPTKSVLITVLKTANWQVLFLYMPNITDSSTRDRNMYASTFLYPKPFARRSMFRLSSCLETSIFFDMKPNYLDK